MGRYIRVESIQDIEFQFRVELQIESMDLMDCTYKTHQTIFALCKLCSKKRSNYDVRNLKMLTSSGQVSTFTIFMKLGSGYRSNTDLTTILPTPKFFKLPTISHKVLPLKSVVLPTYFMILALILI